MLLPAKWEVGSCITCSDCRESRRWTGSLCQALQITFRTYTVQLAHHCTEGPVLELLGTAFPGVINKSWKEAVLILAQVKRAGQFRHLYPQTTHYFHTLGKLLPTHILLHSTWILGHHPYPLGQEVGWNVVHAHSTTLQGISNVHVPVQTHSIRWKTHYRRMHVLPFLSKSSIWIFCIYMKWALCCVQYSHPWASTVCWKISKRIPCSWVSETIGGHNIGSNQRVWRNYRNMLCTVIIYPAVLDSSLTLRTCPRLYEQLLLCAAISESIINILKHTTCQKSHTSLYWRIVIIITNVTQATVKPTSGLRRQLWASRRDGVDLWHPHL